MIEDKVNVDHPKLPEYLSKEYLREMYSFIDNIRIRKEIRNGAEIEYEEHYHSICNREDGIPFGCCVTFHEEDGTCTAMSFLQLRKTMNNMENALKNKDEKR